MLGTIVLAAHLMQQEKPVVPISTSIKTMLARAKSPDFWISPGLAGTVNFKPQGKSFYVDLADLLAQIDATYLRAGGAYNFSHQCDNDYPSEPSSDNDGQAIREADYEGVDLRTALTSFFTSIHASYRIDATVSGTVDFRLHRASVPRVLAYMVAGNYAEWRKEGDIYIVTSIFDHPMPRIDMHDVETKDAVRYLLEPLHTRFRFEPGIHGHVEIHIGPGKLELALQNVMGSTDLIYRFNKGELTFLSRGDPGPGAQVVLFGANPNPSYHFEQVDLRVALKAIFHDANQSYSIPPEIQGKVTLQLSDTTFGEALGQTLKQLNLTFLVEGGVFVIQRRTHPEPIDNPTLAFVGPIHLLKVSIREALKALFADSGYGYILDPKIEGTISLDAGNNQMVDTLQMILRQVDAEYWFANGTFTIVPRRKMPLDILNHVIPLTRYERLDIREVMRQFSASNDICFNLSDLVRGEVTILVKDMTFQSVLEFVLHQVDADFHFERDVLKITPKKHG
ncbi:MAG: hypothetical protein JST12_18700 [Armatimonadetes bacterium]|nr:hypothetical protein [Armatimonadota bacterium]